MGLQPIAFWNLQNIYLAKNLQVLDSTKKKDAGLHSTKD